MYIWKDEQVWILFWILFFLNFIIIIILLYNIVLVLPYISMHPPRVYTCSPSWTSLPIPSFWVIPVHQPQASCVLHRTWTDDSFLIWYYTCFKAILPNHPPLSLSHRVQKTVLYIWVFFALCYFLEKISFIFKVSLHFGRRCLIWG